MLRCMCSPRRFRQGMCSAVAAASAAKPARDGEQRRPHVELMPRRELANIGVNRPLAPAAAEPDLLTQTVDHGEMRLAPGIIARGLVPLHVQEGGILRRVSRDTAPRCPGAFRTLHLEAGRSCAGNLPAAVAMASSGCARIVLAVLGTCTTQEGVNAALARPVPTATRFIETPTSSTATRRSGVLRACAADQMPFILPCEPRGTTGCRQLRMMREGPECSRADRPDAHLDGKGCEPREPNSPGRTALCGMKDKLSNGWRALGG
jgi:hypothetical protein